ncbi:MAG: hypothetical protein DRJ43_06765 [Thermoprotei archaeon]|nr:MAG: hypothetical protein DRJ43_06765 [Thermoprotei archaeon]
MDSEAIRLMFRGTPLSSAILLSMSIACFNWIGSLMFTPKPTTHKGQYKGFLVSPRGVRVRGIYSTAITRLLLDEGIPVVDASMQILERFEGEAVSGGVALVTVKDRDDRRGLVVIGAKPLAEKVLNTLRSRLPLSPIRVMPVELYSTYLCRVVGSEGGLVLVELPEGVRGYLEGQPRLEEFVVAHVVRFKRGVPVLRRGIMIVGNYARLVEGGRHSVSEHIRGDERRILLSLAVRGGLEGWGVRWRSSAKESRIEELLDELKSLKERGERVKRVAQTLKQPSKLTEGEVLAFVTLSLNDKLHLDEIRSRQVPTVKLHHFLKTCGERYSMLVDLAASLYHCCEPNCLSKYLLRGVLEDIRGGRLELLHEKLDGSTFRISGTCEMVSRKPLLLKLTRAIKGGGVYDGIGVPKEEGDRAVSLIAPFSHVLPHAYFNAEGDLKGVYVNINTPIEPNPPSTMWYIDAGIDVVWSEDRGVRTVDLEELEHYGSLGVVTSDAINLFKEIAAKAAAALEEKVDLDTLSHLSLNFTCKALRGILE